MKFYGSLFVLFIFIAGCAPQMSQVMNSCDGYKKFDSYVSCVKTNYERAPNASVVKAFYAYLDAIAEDVRNGRITETRARLEVHKAYEETIGVGNRREAARQAQAWQNYQMMNYMNRTVTTNCSTFGNYTNCTSN